MTSSERLRRRLSHRNTSPDRRKTLWRHFRLHSLRLGKFHFFWSTTCVFKDAQNWTGIRATKPALEWWLPPNNLKANIRNPMIACVTAGINPSYYYPMIHSTETRTLAFPRYTTWYRLVTINFQSAQIGSCFMTVLRRCHLQIMPSDFLPSSPPSRGVYVSGLTLRNAFWDTVKQRMTDDQAVADHCELPITWFKPVERDLAMGSSQVYECPLRTLEVNDDFKLAVNLVTSLPLPSDSPVDVLKRRRVSLVPGLCV